MSTPNQPGTRGRRYSVACPNYSGTDTAKYIAGKEEDGGRESDYFRYVKGNTPSLQRACFDAIQASGQGRAPDHTELDRSHGRTVRRSIWVTDVGDIDFPQVTRIARIRRDHYDSDGCHVSKEIIHAVTSLTEKKADAEALAGIARGQWGIESVHWIRSPGVATPHSPRTRTPDTPGTGRKPWLPYLAISLLYLSGVTEITRTLQAVARDRNRVLDYLPL